MELLERRALQQEAHHDHQAQTLRGLTSPSFRVTLSVSRVHGRCELSAPCPCCPAWLHVEHCCSGEYPGRALGLSPGAVRAIPTLDAYWVAQKSSVEISC